MCIFATLSKTNILKDVISEITTFLVQDPPKSDPESKAKTVLESNVPDSCPMHENYSILDSYWAPQAGDKFEQEASKL